MALSFAFGGDTNTSYDDLKRRRLFGELMLQRGQRGGAPKTAIEGINSAAQSITGALMAKKFGDRQSEQQDQFGMLFNGALNGFQSPGGGGQPSFSAPNQNDAAFPVGTPVTGNEQAPPEFGLGTPAFAGFSPEMQQYANGISAVESDGSGGYSALGPVTNSGDRAYGKFQVMGANIPAWTRKHYGQELTPEQFLASEDAQNAVFNGEFGGYVEQYGNPQDAASMWFSGKPISQAGNASDGFNTVPQYINKFNSALGQGGQQQQQGINPMLLSMLSDPRATDQQRSVLGMLMQQQMQAQDPMRQLQMQKLQGEVDSAGQMTPYQQAQINLAQAKVDNPTAPSGFSALEMQAKSAGLVPNTPEWKDFMLNGGGAPATFRALDMQANAAGFEDGTPEYNDFMATRGAGLAAGAKTTATNVANVATGGAAAEAVAAGTAQGKDSVVQQAELREMERNMPGLMTVVDELDALADKATYTLAGQGLDAVQKQLGMVPRESAVARSEYIAVVDNQVLPLLRQTFGAAFTAKEGETLKNTLGDPNKSPAEKRAVLRAFIEQKKRDIIARGGSVPGSNIDFSAMTSADLGAVDIGKLTPEQMTAMENRFKELGL